MPRRHSSLFTQVLILVALLAYGSTSAAQSDDSDQTVERPDDLEMNEDISLVDSNSQLNEGRGLRVGGWSLFGVSYSLSAVTGVLVMMVGGDGGDAGPGSTSLGGIAFVPVVGPAILGGLSADRSTAAAIWGAVGSLIETAGVMMAIAGSVRSARARPRARSGRSARRQRSLALLPGGPGGTGLSVSGVF